jgi:hypothetical protein
MTAAHSQRQSLGELPLLGFVTSRRFRELSLLLRTE